jgi:hypothetical protein
LPAYVLRPGLPRKMAKFSLDLAGRIHDDLGNALIAGGWPVKGQREEVPDRGLFHFRKTLP